MKEELLPCWRCGGEGTMWELEFLQPRWPNIYYVKCEECGYRAGGTESSAKLASDKWNTQTYNMEDSMNEIESGLS